MMTFQQKKNAFAVEIRREQKQNKLKGLRRKYFDFIPIGISLYDLIEHFDLKNQEQFSEQRIQSDPFILVHILLAKKQNLINITFKRNQMVDQKIIIDHEDLQEVKEIKLPTQYSYKLQTTLYQWIAEDIFKHEGKYSNMDKEIQQLLIDFWIRYLKRNKYTQTAKQKEYHQTIINCLELLLVEMDSPSLRYAILHWVAGTDSLKLISNCVDGRFLEYYPYQRIYQIIQKGLKRQKIQSKLEALQAFYRCTRTGDYDDYNNVVKQMPQLLGNVMNFIFNGQLFQYITQQQNMEYFFMCTQILKNFLDNYEQTRLNIAKQGALMISAILICNQNTQIMKQGLHILNSILDIQEREYSQQIIQMVTSVDKPVYSTGVWTKIGESYEIIKHKKLEIRQLIVQILSKILAIGQMKDIILLNYHIFYPNGQCLVNMLIEMFLHNENKIIRQNIIKSIWSILYYSQSIEQYSQTIEREVERQRTQRLGLNYVCKCIQESGLQKILQKIRQNEEYEYVSQAAVRKQLESIFFILEQKYSR